MPDEILLLSPAEVDALERGECIDWNGVSRL